MICRLFGHSPRYWEWSRAWRCRWCQVELVPRVKQESRAFTTVSVPRPPANAQNLDEFVGQYDPRPSQEVPSTLQYGWQY